MPVTKSAIKKLRQDKKRALSNNKIRKELSVQVKAVKKAAKGASVDVAFSSVDKAVKAGLIHKNKAARIKSQISKIAPKKPSTAKAKKTTPAPKKTAVKKTKKATK